MNPFPPSSTENGITITTAMERLGYSRATVRRLIDRGELIAYGRHKLLRVVESSVEEYKKRNQAGIKFERISEPNTIRPAQYHQAVHELRALGLL